MMLQQHAFFRTSFVSRVGGLQRCPPMPASGIVPGLPAWEEALTTNRIIDRRSEERT
ncbi:hypothetical protein PVAP13_5NG175281 [Panicum virgatum]|uniref:Uncharacterized protein n=1 Tax=Panicum virgatum TaxID=38727 RepID=A0A8T0RPD7_PANVG|nr:hypothetical protein PVAP13_5NG175281 [Panicum virgatum]